MRASIAKRLIAGFAAIAVPFLVAPLATSASGPADQTAEHLAGAVQFKTISHQDPAQMDAAPFTAFSRYLEQTYPRLHQTLRRERINNLSLLYVWPGSDPSAPPAVLAAHTDVVPIAPGTEANWTYPPFSGRIADGFVWGRGTMDCKGFLIAEMEAVESLIAAGHAPRRTILLAFGHDEEIGGWEGAAKIAARLEASGARLAYVIDEGGFIIDGSIMGIDKPLAMVGIAEKGYLTLELSVKAEGGHSSMPPRETAIGILAGAIHRLEQKPFPARLEGVSIKTFESLGPELPPSMRAAIKGRWLLGGVIKNMLSKIDATNAMIRTTTAPTIIAAGTKENVLPQEARAVVNFRLLPGDGIDYAIGRVNQVINDPRVSVDVVGRPRESSQVSSLDSEGFGIVKKTIAESFPETVIAPYLVLGGTDASHYENQSDSIYRFSPLRGSQEDQERAHGTNERIGVDNLQEIVEFYKRLIVNSD